MKLSLKMLFSAALTVLVQCSFAADIVKIRKADKVPFYSNGKRIEAVWKNADTVTGLVNPKNAIVEFSPTKAQMLYDENNLYVSMIANYHPPFRAPRNPDASLWGDNNFELFLMADGAQEYFQIAVSENGGLYRAIGKNKMPLVMKHWVFTEKKRYRWMANLTIPLSTLKWKPEEQKIRFNVCRYNQDMPKGKAQQSSFMVLQGGLVNYHLPDMWPVAEMTAKSGKAKSVAAHSDNIKVNLIPDPGFDFPTRTFKNPDIQRMETMAMSDIWIIRATGKAYHFYTLGVAGRVTPGEKYTIRVRARRYGKEGSLGLIQFCRNSEGKTQEGGRISWGIPLTEEFQEYYIKFVPRPNVTGIALYRIGSKSKENGVELENVSLFKGDISSFEIRKIGRAGVKNVVPGTEIKRPENPYGKVAKPIRILVIGRRNLLALNDPWEIMNGLNIQRDCITTTATNTDVYYTDDDPKAIFQRLKDKTYDLIMIGGYKDAVTNIGKELAKQLEACVKNGTSLWINLPAPYGNLSALVKNAGMKKLADTHYLKQALPLAFFKKPAAFRNYSHNPLDNMKEGKFGKGYVLTAQTASRNAMFLIDPDYNAGVADTFPWSDFNKAWLARLMVYAAGKENRIIRNIKVTNCTNAVVETAAVEDNTALRWNVMDKLGNVVDQGTGVIRKNQAAIKMKDPAFNGDHVLTVWALDKAGKTIAYSAQTFRKNGPILADLKDNKLYYKENEKADLSVSIRDFKPGMMLEWTLEDFSGRILQRGKVKGSANAKLAIPLESLYTNYSAVTVYLKVNGKTVDAARIPVVAQDRDKKRVLDDFTPSIWNFGGDLPEGFRLASDRQLEKIGFRSYLLPFLKLTGLKTGMTTGASWRCSSTFYGYRQAGTSNIRQRQFNTKESRAYIAKSAYQDAKNLRYLGVVHDHICDEPGLTNHVSSLEFDEHPQNLAVYRERMEAKYKTIANFNQQMGTSYRSFKELKPGRIDDARKAGRYGEFMEWRNFNVDRWVEAIRIVADNSKKGDPNSNLSLCNSFGQTALNGNDYWKLLTKAGLNFSQEYTSMVYQGDSPRTTFDEFYRSFRPDMRVWGYTGYFFDRTKAFYQPWWFALHRYGGFTWFATYASVGAGGGGAWLNILDYTGAFNRDAQNMKDSLESSNLQNGLGKVFLAYNWVKNDIAIYYSHDSLLLAYALGKERNNSEMHTNSPLSKKMTSRHNLQYMTEELLYQYEYLAPEQIINGKLKERKVLFMPGVISMGDEEVAAVRTFLKNGGMVIADFTPGEYDLLGRKRKQAPFAGEKNVVVLNKLFTRKDVAQRKQIMALLKKANCKPLIQSKGIEQIFGREAMHFADGDMHIFGVLHDQSRSSEAKEQTFQFPVTGHLYDIRAGKYLGKTNTVTAAVPRGDAMVWGIYPYQIKGIDLSVPTVVKGGQDLMVKMELDKTGFGKAGKHVFHVEIIAPDGSCRFHMQRNLIAENGKAVLKFRMAENDKNGTWKVRVTDALSGIQAEKTFRKSGQ